MFLICWDPSRGLHILAKHIRERLGYIAEELKDYDIVALQEVWKDDDFSFLAQRLQDSLPYSHYFHSAIIGSGLCIFSRYPTMTAFTHQFSVTGGISDFTDGEIFAGKGILGCRIQTPVGNVVVYTLHVNPRCRDSQLFECVQFVERSRGNDMIIVTGDFNTKPSHAAYSMMIKCLNLKDVYEDNPVDTCDLPTNIFTLRRMTPKRIDFIMYSDEYCPQHSLSLQHRRLSLSGHIPGKSFPYSDHEGVEANFLVERMAEPIEVPERGLDDEAMQILLNVSQNIKQRKAKYQRTKPGMFGMWFILGVVSLFTALLLSNHYLVTFLASYYLHWMCTLTTGLVYAGSILHIFRMFSDVQLVHGMEANLFEIRTLLNYGKGHHRHRDGSNATLIQ